MTAEAHILAAVIADGAEARATGCIRAPAARRVFARLCAATENAGPLLARAWLAGYDRPEVA